MNLEQTAHPKPQHKGTRQLFENPLLERLTRTHIAVPVSIFCLYAVLLLAYCFRSTVLGPETIIPLFVGGLVLFTFAEYWIHRSLYHMHPKSVRAARIQYKVHGVHHEFPKDKDRLAMPPWLSVLVATTLLWLFQAALGDSGLALLSGFLLGYALYLLVHYSTHAFAPPKNALKLIWDHHAIHHYKDQNKAFGVSSPLWDYVFGTNPPRKKAGPRIVSIASPLHKRQA